MREWVFGIEVIVARALRWVRSRLDASLVVLGCRRGWRFFGLVDLLFETAVMWFERDGIAAHTGRYHFRIGTVHIVDSAVEVPRRAIPQLASHRAEILESLSEVHAFRLCVYVSRSPVTTVELLRTVSLYMRTDSVWPVPELQHYLY
jgi:hypothetical protein